MQDAIPALRPRHTSTLCRHEGPCTDQSLQSSSRKTATHRPCYGPGKNFSVPLQQVITPRASGSGGAAACSELQFQATRDGAAKHGLSKRTCAMRLAGLLCASLLCALGRGAAAACEGDSCPEDQAAAHRDHLLGAAAPSCPRVRKYPQDGSKLKPVRAAPALRATSVCCPAALGAAAAGEVWLPDHRLRPAARPVSARAPAGGSGGAGAGPVVGRHEGGDGQGAPRVAKLGVVSLRAPAW